eukprot:365965-Chlamydomonas_euryale.AAC.15
MMLDARPRRALHGGKCTDLVHTTVPSQRGWHAVHVRKSGIALPQPWLPPHSRSNPTFSLPSSGRDHPQCFGHPPHALATPTCFDTPTCHGHPHMPWPHPHAAVQKFYPSPSGIPRSTTWPGCPLCHAALARWLIWRWVIDHWGAAPCHVVRSIAGAVPRAWYAAVPIPRAR